MSGYFNSLFSTTASHVATLKQNLLPSVNDGGTEDDTHICRVLRGYYTEKGRAFPAWLPPDPRAPPPVVVQPVYTQSNVGRGYGGLNQPGAGQGSGNLSSLWDSQPQQQMQQQQMEPQSLRPAGRTQASARHNPFARQQSAQQHESQVQARPLPSQRAGSQQTAGGSPFARPDSGGAPVVMSARDKLKAGFGQKRSGSPAVSDQGQGYRNDSYQSSSGGGGRGYESRSNAAPYPSGGGGLPYPSDNYGGGGGGGGYDGGSRGGGGGGGERPFVAATAPWASNEMEFSGGGYNAGYDDRNSRRQGLPSGPGAGRKGPGLPSGPRGPRY